MPDFYFAKTLKVPLNPIIVLMKLTIFSPVLISWNVIYIYCLANCLDLSILLGLFVAVCIENSTVCPADFFHFLARFNILSKLH